MSSETWEIVDAVEGISDGSQQVHLCASQQRSLSNWCRIVSVARHYYRLRHLMGIIGSCLKENKQIARNALFDEFPEVDPKRFAREAKAKAKSFQRKGSPHPKSTGKEASVVNKSRGRSVKQRLHQVKRGTSTDSGASERGKDSASSVRDVPDSEFVRVVTDTGVRYVRSQPSQKQVAVTSSSVPSAVIADIESGHYRGTHWYKGQRIGSDDKVEVYDIQDAQYQ